MPCPCFGPSKAGSVDRAIESAICEAHVQSDTTRKMLLLGSGESGKSTVFKQTSILFNEHAGQKGGFTPTERRAAVWRIRENVSTNMLSLVRAAQEKEEETTEHFLAAQAHFFSSGANVW